MELGREIAESIWRVKEKVKKRFITELVLVILDLDKEMRVEADALDFAIGGVLSMKCEDEKWKPVAYISKLLNEAKKELWNSW